MKLSKKPDEMEKVVSYQAMRITWRIVNVIWVALIALAAILFIWAVFHITDWSSTEWMSIFDIQWINFLVMYIIPSFTSVIVLEVVYYMIKAILRYNMTKGGREK